MGPIWVKFKNRNKKALELIKEKEEEIRLKEIKRIQNEEKIINNKINKFIEEAKNIGKKQAKEEIAKLEIQTNEKIKEEEKKNNEEKIALEKDYKEKVIKIETETDDKIEQLKKLVEEALKDYHKTK